MTMREIRSRFLNVPKIFSTRAHSLIRADTFQLTHKLLMTSIMFWATCSFVRSFVFFFFSFFCWHSRLHLYLSLSHLFLIKFSIWLTLFSVLYANIRGFVASILKTKSIGETVDCIKFYWFI